MLYLGDNTAYNEGMQILETGRIYKWGDHLVEITMLNGSWINFTIKKRDDRKGFVLYEQVTIEHFMMHLDMEYEFYKDILDLS